MCLAVPMQIKTLNDKLARCEACGVSRDVSLQLIEDQAIAVGDFVLVHLGYAIQKVPAPDARTCWESYDAMQQASDMKNCHNNSDDGNKHA